MNWRDETLVLDPGLLGRLRRQLMSLGRRNRQLPRVAKTLLDAMWRQVQGERGRERGREAFEDDMLGHEGFVDFATAWWPPLDAQTVFGWLREPDFLARVGEGVISREEQLVLLKSWADGGLSIEDVPLVDELATPSVTSRSAPTTSATSTRPACSRAASICRNSPHLRAGVRPRRAGLVRADPPHRGRRLRPRPHRRGAGPDPDAVAHGRSPRPHRELDDRRRPRAVVGPDAPEAASARAEALEGKELHEFHLSTNYRNSAEIYAFAADYARRVGLDADLPEAVRRTGEEPRVVGPVQDLEAAVREAVTSTAARVEGTVGIVVPVARRSEVNAWLASWPEVADDAAGARAAVDSSVTPSGEDRVVVRRASTPRGWSSTASWSSRHRRSRTSRPPAGRPSTSCSPERRSC